MMPTFTVTSGVFQSTSAHPTGSLVAVGIRRDMDVAADALELHFGQKPNLSLGADITVALGYDGTEKTVFTGRTTGLQPALVGYTVRALGMMNALLNLRTAALFEKKTPGQIVRSLVGEAGIAAGRITQGSTLPQYAVDHRQSAYAHLRKLAERLGFEFYTTAEGRVNFHVPTGAGLPTRYGYGQHLLAAEFREAKPAWGKVTVGAESPMSSKGDKVAHWLTVRDKDFQQSAGWGKPQLLVNDPVARSNAMAKTFAAGRLHTASRRAKLLQLRVVGTADLDLGDLVAVQDMPDNLTDATGYVCAIHHQLSGTQGYVTDLTLAAKS